MAMGKPIPDQERLALFATDGLPVAGALERIGDAIECRFLPMLGDQHQTDRTFAFAEPAG